MDLRLLKSKHKMDIRGIIQVGSHVSSEYEILREVSKGPFVMIDANPNIIDKLISNTDEDCLVLNYLLSEEDGKEYNFTILEHEQSSSMLELDKHIDYHPEYSKISRVVKMKSKRLDSIFSEKSIDPDLYNTVMMDVQGAELLVLMGFEKNLQKMDYVYTEVNYDSMYKNCVLERDLTQYLSERNFSLVQQFNTGFGWGDALYIKKDLI